MKRVACYRFELFGCSEGNPLIQYSTIDEFENDKIYDGIRNSSYKKEKMYYQMSQNASLSLIKLIDKN